MITSEELNKLLHSTSNEHIKNKANLLLNAINDWPVFNLSEPNEFIIELNKEISGPLTFNNLNEFIQTLNPNTQAWKIESITYILEIFDGKDFEKNRDLENIIQTLSMEYYHNQNSLNE